MWVWLHRAAPVDCSLSPTEGLGEPVFPLPHASLEALGFAHSCPAWWKEVCVSVCVCVCPVTPWRWDGIVLHRKLGLTSAVTSSRFYFVLLFLCPLPF